MFKYQLLLNVTDEDICKASFIYNSEDVQITSGQRCKSQDLSNGIIYSLEHAICCIIFTSKVLSKSLFNTIASGKLASFTFISTLCFF